MCLYEYLGTNLTLVTVMCVTYGRCELLILYSVLTMVILVTIVTMATFVTKVTAVHEITNIMRTSYSRGFALFRHTVC